MTRTFLLFVALALMAASRVCLMAAEQSGNDFEVRPGFKVINSVAALRAAMNASNGKIRMKPGEYPVTDAMDDNVNVFLANGSNNDFDLRGVTLKIDTTVLANLRGKAQHLVTFQIKGSGLTFDGATFEDVGENPPYTSTAEFTVSGDNDTFTSCTFIIRGSAPYGYGLMFGKGRGSNAKDLQKHSAMAVSGNGTRILGCKFYMYTFGHAIHMHGAQNTLIQDTYIEGKLRSSDEILAEKTGPAAEAGYRDAFGKPLEKGLMIALPEDGIRAYGPSTEARPRTTGETGVITAINCTVIRMRGGINLAEATKPARVENCTVRESGWPGANYRLPSGSIVRDCKGDAAYAPLLVLDMNTMKDTSIALEVLDAKAYTRDHFLAVINGSGHKITLTKNDGKALGANLPVVCGQGGARWHDEKVGSGKAPKAQGITLINNTPQPVILTKDASGCTVKSHGSVSDAGAANTVAKTGD